MQDAEHSERYPKLIVFDLDYTLWDLWIDTHATPPFSREGETLNEIVDRVEPFVLSDGRAISFYPEVATILSKARQVMRTTQLALASRTDTPQEASEALNLLLIRGYNDDQPRRAIEYFDHQEIYPGSKLNHFRALHRKTGIEFKDMLFFDDERRNREVERLGVTFFLVHQGMTERIFWAGLDRWRENLT